MFNDLHILYIIVQSISNLQTEHYAKQLVGAKYFVRKMSSARSFLHPKSTGGGTNLLSSHLSRKLHENEKHWNNGPRGGGGARPKSYYVDPPLAQYE